MKFYKYSLYPSHSLFYELLTWILIIYLVTQIQKMSHRSWKWGKQRYTACLYRLNQVTAQSSCTILGMYKWNKTTRVGDRSRGSSVFDGRGELTGDLPVYQIPSTYMNFQGVNSLVVFPFQVRWYYSFSFSNVIIILSSPFLGNHVIGPFRIIKSIDFTLPCSCGTNGQSHHKQKLSIEAHMCVSSVYRLYGAPESFPYSFIQ